MCSFTMISHRGDVTDSNLPRAHRAREHARACAPGSARGTAVRNRRHARIVQDSEPGHQWSFLRFSSSACTGTIPYYVPPRARTTTTVLQSLCSPSPYFILRIQLDFPVTTFPRSECPRSRTQMCEMRTPNGKFGFPESSLRQVERHHWASESPFSVK